MENSRVFNTMQEQLKKTEEKFANILEQTEKRWATNLKEAEQKWALEQQAYSERQVKQAEEEWVMEHQICSEFQDRWLDVRRITLDQWSGLDFIEDRQTRNEDVHGGPRAGV